MAIIDDVYRGRRKQTSRKQRAQQWLYLLHIVDAREDARDNIYSMIEDCDLAVAVA